MELQEAIILGLAFAALVISILSIVFGIIFFRAQMRQAQSIAKDNSDFTLQMNMLLSEIRASQNVTGQQIKDQYDKLLDAAIHSAGGSMEAVAASAVQFGEFSERLDSLAKSVAELKDPGKIGEQIKELRKIEETLNTTIRQLVTHVTEEQKEQKQPKSRVREKLTERAYRAIMVAEEEARKLNHSYVGTEHLLLGLLREEEGLAARVLTSLGIDVDKVGSAVKFIIGSGEEAVKGGIGLTPRAKRVIELAIDEARNLGNKRIGTEHLLLGMLHEGEGVGASVLDSFHVTAEKVKAEITKLEQKD